MSGYFDLQVNGFAGVDFNGDDLTADDLNRACKELQSCRVDQFLPTVITDEPSKMADRVRRILHARSQDPLSASMIPGIHLEGPFISNVPGYVGAHPAQHAIAADVEIVKMLIDVGQGFVKFVTLAPERDAGMKIVRWLADHKVRVAAGHTDAPRDILMAAIDAGLTGFTHLGNGCPTMLARHDNIITRIISLRDHLNVSLIGDGHHLPVWLLKTFIDIFGVKKTFLVTDAISAARLGPGQYRLGIHPILIGDDGVARSADGTHFVGSTTDMIQMDAILESIGLDEAARKKLLADNARSFLYD